jgi:hypothetical protein
VGKPSIFSRDYQKQMKKRKKRITFTIFIVVIVGVFVTISMKGMVKNLSKYEGKSKNIITADKNNIKSTESKKVEATEQEKAKKSEAYDIQLSNGKTVSVLYETKNNDKTFKQGVTTDSNVSYNISPSRKKVILFDDKVQSIILVDINGNKEDVTNPQYTSTSGTVIEKNAQLSSQPNYIWCSSPRFIDDNSIAYISQLPWIGKTTKYVWIENLGEKSNVIVQEIQGQELKLEGLTDKGLTVIEDGKTVFLKSDGSISE